MVGGGGSPQRGSITEDTSTSSLKNNAIPTWMKAANRTPTKEHISYKQFMREEKPIVSAKYPFLTSSQIERKLRLEWQTTMRGEKGRCKGSRSSPHKSTSTDLEYLVNEVEADRQERVFSPKVGSRLGTKTYGGGASWIHQSLTPPKIIQKETNKGMNGILSRSSEKPRGSTGKVSFQKMMPSRERSKSESSVAEERHQSTSTYTPKCNMRKTAQEKEKFGCDIYSLSDSDSDKEHQLTTLHKSAKGSASKRGSATKSARRTAHAHTRIRKSKDQQKIKCALLFDQENSDRAEEGNTSPFLGTELSDSDDERDRQLLGLEGNVLMTETQESERKQKKPRKSASSSNRPRATGRQRTITSMFNVMETFSNKDGFDKSTDEKYPKPLSDTNIENSKHDNDYRAIDHFREKDTTELFCKISKLKRRILGTVAEATPENTEGANKLIKMIQTPSTDGKTVSDLTTPANPESLVQQVIKKASKVPHKKRPNEQITQSENTLGDTVVTTSLSSPKQKRARRSLDVANSSTSSNVSCPMRNTQSVTQTLELESPLAEPFCPNKGKSRKSSIATFKQSDISVSQDSEQELEMEPESTPLENIKSDTPPKDNISLSSPKVLKVEFNKRKTSAKAAITEGGGTKVTESESTCNQSSVSFTSPKRMHTLPAPNIRRTPVRIPVKNTLTGPHGGLPVTPSPRSNTRRAQATPVYRRSPRLSKEIAPTKESPEPIPIFKTPKGIPGKAKTRKSMSPKLTSNINEEASLITEGFNNDTLVERDNSMSTGLGEELGSEQSTAMGISLSGGLNTGTGLDSSVPSGLNNDKDTTDTTISRSPKKLQNMSVSSFYKSRLKQKKGNTLPKSSHNKLPAQSIGRSTPAESKRSSMKPAKSKDSKAKGPSKILHYFGFEDLDDNDMAESNSNTNSDPSECKHGNEKTKNAPVIENADAVQNDNEEEHTHNTENRVPTTAMRAANVAKDKPKIKGPSVSEAHQGDDDADDKHTLEDQVPVKAKKSKEVASHPSTVPTLYTAASPALLEDKTTNKENSNAKGNGHRKKYFGFGDLDDDDKDESHNKENSIPTEHPQDKHQTDNKGNMKCGNAKRGKREAKGPSDIVTSDVETNQYDYRINNDKVIKENWVSDKTKEMVEVLSESTSPDVSETDLNDLEISSTSIKEIMNPAKSMSGRRKRYTASGMESLNIETDQNVDKINEGYVEEHRKPNKTKSRRRKSKDVPEVESVHPSETDYEVDNKHKKRGDSPDADARIDDIDTKEKAKPLKTNSSRHKMEEDTAESCHSDYEIDDKYINESEKPHMPKKVRHRKNDTRLESPKKVRHRKKETRLESWDAAETHYEGCRLDDTQNILSINPLDSLVEGFRKKSALQFNQIFNWDSALQEDNEEKSVDADENDMLTGHLNKIVEDEKSDDTPPPTQSQSGMTAVQDALQKLRTIASPNILNVDEFIDYEFEEVLSSLKSSQHSSQVSDLSSLSLPSDQENSIPAKSATRVSVRSPNDTEHFASTKKDITTFRKPQDNPSASSGDHMKEARKTCAKMTYGKKKECQIGQGDGLSWASELFDGIVEDPAGRVGSGVQEKPKEKQTSVQPKQRERPKTPDVDVCSLFEETPRTSARRLLTSSRHQTDSNFQDLFSTKDSLFFM